MEVGVVDERVASDRFDKLQVITSTNILSIVKVFLLSNLSHTIILTKCFSCSNLAILLPYFMCINHSLSLT